MDNENQIIVTEEDKQKRWRSPALWAAIVGLLGTIGFSSGLFERAGITNEVWASIGTLLGTILTVFGIANNPTDGSNF